MHNKHQELIAEKVAEIPMAHGKVALVDSCDYDELSKYKWHANKSTHTSYAQTNGVKENGLYTKKYMHRIILGLKKGEVCDHINGDGLDNRRSNLRRATVSQNAVNKRPHGSSKFKGVSWSKKDKRYVTYLQKEGVPTYLGSYTNEIDAAAAYNRAAIAVHGEFVRLNVLTC